MSLQPTIQYLLSCQKYARLENEILSWSRLFVTLCVTSYNNSWFFPRNVRWTNQRPAFYDVTMLAVTRIRLPFVFVSSSVRELFAIRASHKLRSFCIPYLWPLPLFSIDLDLIKNWIPLLAFLRLVSFQTKANSFPPIASQLFSQSYQNHTNFTWNTQIRLIVKGKFDPPPHFCNRDLWTASNNKFSYQSYVLCSLLSTVVNNSPETVFNLF